MEHIYRRTRRQRVIFGLIMLFVMLSAWLIAKSGRAHRRAQAARAIDDAGGWVLYDWSSESGEPPYPWLLRRLLGDDFFQDVVWVHLSGVTQMREVMACVATLKCVEVLELDDSSVSDDDMRCIANLARLSALRLDRTQITDRALHSLRGLSHIEYLSLIDTRVSDSGLEHLQALGSLRRLSLDSTSVSMQGVQELRRALPSTEISWSQTLGEGKGERERGQERERGHH